MIKEFSEKWKTIYFNNNYTQEDIKKVIEILKVHKKVNISFGVNGRTKHEMLGQGLIDKIKKELNIIGVVDYQSYKVEIQIVE